MSPEITPGGKGLNNIDEDKDKTIEKDMNGTVEKLLNEAPVPRARIEMLFGKYSA